MPYWYDGLLAVAASAARVLNPTDATVAMTTAAAPVRNLRALMARVAFFIMQLTRSSLESPVLWYTEARFSGVCLAQIVPGNESLYAGDMTSGTRTLSSPSPYSPSPFRLLVILVI